MKLWRKLAMVNGKRSGRQIKYMHQMQESIFKQQARTYPLLSQLFASAGIVTQPAAEIVNDPQ